MASLICRKCGKQTNSIVSEYWNEEEGYATKCYASYVDGKYIKGCAYDEADGFTKQTVDVLIK